MNINYSDCEIFDKLEKLSNEINSESYTAFNWRDKEFETLNNSLILILKQHFNAFICVKEKHDKCKFLLDISAFSWIFNILNEIFYSLFKKKNLKPKFENCIKELFRYIEENLKLSDFIFLYVDECINVNKNSFNNKKRSLTEILNENKKTYTEEEKLKNCKDNFLLCTKDCERYSHNYYKEYKNTLNETNKRKGLKSEFNWYLYFRDFRNLLAHFEFYKNIIPENYQITEIIDFYQKKSSKFYGNFSTIWKKYEVIKQNMFIFNIEEKKEDRRKYKGEIKLCISKILPYEILMLFFKYINKTEIIKKWRNIFKKPKNKISSKKLELIIVEYKNTEYDFININSNSKSELYDIRIYYKYNYQSPTKQRKWFYQYKKTNDVNWENYWPYNWNWEHKGAYLGKMFQKFIKKNEILVFKNLINITGYNTQQPDFHLIFLLMYIFRFKKGIWKEFGSILWKNEFVDNNWRSSWSKLTWRHCPFIFNNMNIIENKNIVVKKYETNIKFKYFKIINNISKI